MLYGMGQGGGWFDVYEKCFRLISGLDFYLRKENCYRDHLQLFSAAKVHNTDSRNLCNIFFEFFF